MQAPIIKPIRTKEFSSKQSKYEHCGKLPMRSVILDLEKRSSCKT